MLRLLLSRLTGQLPLLLLLLVLLREQGLLGGQQRWQHLLDLLAAAAL